MTDGITPGAGTPAPGGLHPADLAAVDQHTAQLRDLVSLVRDHHAAHGTPPVPHPGRWAWDQILDVLDDNPHHLAGLLGMALAELAALGYGLPTAEDTYHLTDRARRELASPEDWPW